MLLFCEICLECLRQLIGARRAFEAATNALQALDGVRDLHAFDQRGNALGIARATAVVLNVCDHTVFNINVNHSGANALGLISNGFHSCVSFRFSEMGIDPDHIVVWGFHGEIQQKDVEICIRGLEEKMG